MLDLSVVILTFNEAKHIVRAIESLSGLGAKIYVVDSYSTDETVELARDAGATVVQHAFVSQAQQFEWGLDNLPIDTGWVMRLDADELLTPELTREIEERLAVLPPDVTGVTLKRRHVFLGRWIRHGGRYPVTLLRIWRNGTARIEQRWMDEHMVLLTGRAVPFEHDFIDHNLNDITFFTKKHNDYATRETLEVLLSRYGLATPDKALAGARGSVQASRKRIIKEGLYNRLPMLTGPLGYFLFRYVVQAGFLDGREGLIYHVLQGFWYRFLVAAKTYEFEQGMQAADRPEDRLRHLEKVSGYRLRPQYPDQSKPAALALPADRPARTA